MDYSKLTKIYSELELEGSSLKKTDILAEFLKDLKPEFLEKVILLLQGKVFPDWSDKELGIGVRLVLKALSSTTGIPVEKIESEWSKIGDIGIISENLIKNKKQRTLFFSKNSLNAVFEKLQKIAELEGSGAVDKKVSLIKDLISNSSAEEAKYILRTCLGDLRVGVGAGILRDSISLAFNVKKDLIQNAYNLSSDFTEVAIIAKQKGDDGLLKVKIKLQKPLKVMLFQKAESIENGFERVGKPAAIEYKYDGFMVQVHKNRKNIEIYTRSQENVTNQFPDLVQRVSENIKAEKCLLIAEVVGIDDKTGNWLAFQNISQRIKRKYNIEEIIKKIPVGLMIFDIVYLETKDLLDTPFLERRNILKKIIIESKNNIELSKQIITEDLSETEKFYKESLKKGNEGIMMKNLSAGYQPGSRVGYAVKVKPIMESLDLVIISADWGNGKRAGWLTSFELACLDPKTKEFKAIGKMGTGIKEKEEEGTSFKQFTELIEPLIIKKQGKNVKITPKIVVEVGYEEIQASSAYDSGFALRFPRLLKLREDKTSEEIDTLERVKDLYSKQRYRK